MSRCVACGGSGRIYGPSNISFCGSCRGSGFTPDPPEKVTEVVATQDPDRWVKKVEQLMSNQAKRREDDQDKKIMRERARSKLIHEWDHTDPKYPKNTMRLRLVAIAHHTPGYEDEFSVSELKTDDMGEPMWVQIHRWKPDSDTKTWDILVSAVKSLLRDPGL